MIIEFNEEIKEEGLEEKKEEISADKGTDDNLIIPLNDEKKEKNEGKRVFTINGEAYELSYTDRKIESIERALGNSIQDIIYSRNGMLAMWEQKILFSNALRKVGGGNVSPKQGVDICEFMQKEPSIGVLGLNEAIFEAIMHDLPFLFPGI